MDISLLIFLGLSFAAAMTGSLFPPGPWYETLAKPSWRPPNYVFPIVWTVLFILIAVSAWRVWTTAPPEALAPAMTVYGVQLVLNAAWSPIFFGLRRMRWALVDLALLWLSIVAMIAVFLPIDGLAAALLLPYLAWVSTAGVLNWTMIRLNPDGGSRTAAQGWR